MIHTVMELIKIGPRSRFFRLVALLGTCTVATWAQVPKPAKFADPAKPTTNAALSPTHKMTPGDVEAFLDGIVPMQLQREDIAGAAVVIVKNGAVFFSKGYGYADVKARRPVSPDSTLFRPGSISKTFTWTAVMQLVEQGKDRRHRKEINICIVRDPLCPLWFVNFEF
jgi:CubicO group peptidase (beta-lactamase class C family)